MRGIDPKRLRGHGPPAVPPSPAVRSPEPQITIYKAENVEKISVSIKVSREVKASYDVLLALVADNPVSLHNHRERALIYPGMQMNGVAHRRYPLLEPSRRSQDLRWQAFSAAGDQDETRKNPS